ncbi:signal peptide peptidase protease IV [Campylobacter iguaniorum]|uniref:Signal peptide peptidase protease IV n=1 Tax=Campylobacter iguaniorum TaxID=1244531 RepID=A0A076FBB4_9BACT|nr:signal peptide peptidase SppA [Campylobacter iguaniorum]AII15276.1 signal peptide peptidase protease IV [Campylobacter iguaniorum]ALV25202.1 signal peptide peptidase protease IV [Campylobacter iguaniorum]
MQILKMIFAPFVAVFKFVNTYFKSSIFFLIVVLILANSSTPKVPNLATIDIKGEIVLADEVLDEIYAAMDDDSIKGVLLDIDSPGGALSPSIAMSDAIKELASKKPTIAYASGTMASGSYYAGIWADKIYANRGSFIGSIGVIMQGANIKELADKIGIKAQTIKAGKFKEAGTFARQWSDEEKAELQGLIDRSYEMFYTDVASARGLDVKAKDNWANARVFLGSEAVSLGLIDDVKSIKEAKDELASLSGVSKQIWKEKPVMDKFISNLTKESANLMMKVFFGGEIR